MRAREPFDRLPVRIPGDPNPIELGEFPPPWPLGTPIEIERELYFIVGAPVRARGADRLEHPIALRRALRLDALCGRGARGVGLRGGARAERREIRLDAPVDHLAHEEVMRIATRLPTAKETAMCYSHGGSFHHEGRRVPPFEAPRLYTSTIVAATHCTF